MAQEKLLFFIRRPLMAHYIKIIILFLTGIGGCFANTNDELRHYQKEGAHQVSTISSKTIEMLKRTSSRNQSEHQSLIDTLMQRSTDSLQSNQKPQGAEGAILFVSFSMPDSLLFALSDEAARFHIPVVINGLVDGDFKQTIETFKRLNSEAQKQHLNFKGISIDPVWFSQFHITTVPALVVTEPSKSCGSGQSCTNQPFDVVYGNASIKKGLELIAQKGDAGATLAATILEKGHV
ncbi:TPA: type-F conjugative transfer system pilin assembly protein TrbC [Legionella pneumophila]|nr:type-F conjugative transfer system pilin assembly protein TrbC [Legionella pneumophila]